jgi:hypothetical protein
LKVFMVFFVFVFFVGSKVQQSFISANINKKIIEIFFQVVFQYFYKKLNHE